MVEKRTPDPALPRILVVDDETVPRMAMAEALNLMGYRADMAASGVEAMLKLSAQPYDLMLLDLHMPGLDGVEVMKRVRQVHPHLLVVVLTAYGSLESAIEAIRAGAVDYLLKPCSIRDTEAAIAKALEDREGPGSPGVFAESPSFPAGQREVTLACGPLVLEPKKNRVVFNGIPQGDPPSTDLTASEMALLTYFLNHPDTVFTCAQLARNALGYSVSEIEAQDIVCPHISRLRRKIQTISSDPGLIRTIRGRGYLFSPGER